MYAGHVVCKKIMLEGTWQVVRYLRKIGAVEGNDRAFLISCWPLVQLTVWGRMMQVIYQ